jgi:hypothetical protein
MSRPAREMSESRMARRGVSHLLVGAVALVGASALLWAAGAAIPGPGTLDAPGLARWVERDPVVVAFAAVRLLGLALAGWVASSTVVALAVHTTRLRRRATLRRAVDRLCLPAVRRVVHGAVGASLSVVVLAQGVTGAAAVPTTVPPPSASVLAAATGSGRHEVAVLVALPATTPDAERGPEAADPDRGPSPTTSFPPPQVLERALLVALDPAPPQPQPTPPVAAVDPEPAAAAVDTWTVVRGEHLWHVSEATLERRLGAPADDAVVAAYLGRLIEANRDRLAVPDDPDLLFAGQELLLPPV